MRKPSMFAPRSSARRLYGPTPDPLGDKAPRYQTRLAKARRFIAAGLLAGVTLTDVRLRNAKIGENTITVDPAGVGDVIRWSAAGPAPGAGSLDIGMSAGGSILAPTGFDVGTAGTLTLGGTTATGVTLGKAGVAATSPGGLLSSSLDTAGVGTLTIGGANANVIAIGAGSANVGIMNGGSGGFVTIGNSSGVGCTVSIVSDSATGLTVTGNAIFKDNNLNKWLSNVAIASAVNFISIANAITGTAPTVEATGTDTNVSLSLLAKGTGTVFAQVGTDSTIAFALHNSGSIAYVTGDSTNGRLGVGIQPRVTLDAASATGTQIGGVGSNYVAFVDNSANSATAGALIIAGGDNSATLRAVVSFREHAALGTEVGTITISTTATAYVTTSDGRLKDGIVDSEKGLADLLKIRVREFHFKHDQTKTVQHGFIAQELLSIYPHAVYAPEDPVHEEDVYDPVYEDVVEEGAIMMRSEKPVIGEDGKPMRHPSQTVTRITGKKLVHKKGDPMGKAFWGIDYGRITPLLVKSIQELAERVVRLEKAA